MSATATMTTRTETSPPSSPKSISSVRASTGNAQTPESPCATPTRKRLSRISALSLSPAKARSVFSSSSSPKRSSSATNLTETSPTTSPTRAVSSRFGGRNGHGDAAGNENEKMQDLSTVASNASSIASTASTRSLGFSSVANLLLKLRRAKHRAQARALADGTRVVCDSGPEPITHDSLKPPSPEPERVLPEGLQVPRIILSELSDNSADGQSGNANGIQPIQEEFDEASEVPRPRARMALQDSFMCESAVDVPKLLRASRGTLLDRAGLFHADILIQESWSCTINKVRSSKEPTYRVLVKYTATAARSPTNRRLKDPRQPVAVEVAQSSSITGGLMTILNREITSLKVELCAIAEDEISWQ